MGETKKVLFLSPLLALLYLVFATNLYALHCCDSVTGQCASACKQISIQSLTLDPGSDSYPVQLTALSTTCPFQLVNFWNCINESLNALREGALWQGRSCCAQAQSSHCQSACFMGRENSDVEHGCRQSDEPALFHCLHHQRELEECCGQSNRPDCVATCQALLRGPPLTPEILISTTNKLSTACERELSLITCVFNITQPITTELGEPQKFLPCCTEGRNQACRETCQNVFHLTQAIEKVVIDTLVSGGCGQPRPDDRMWGCFLKNVQPLGATTSQPTTHRLGLDAAKLHCCHRSRDEGCRRLCDKTFSREWSHSWAEFDSICLSSVDQSLLRGCLEELDEPCQIGCEGLQFCTNFYSNPAQLFRRCSAAADMSAQAQFESWMSSGEIPLGTYRLPIRNDSTCDHKWKQVACTLELKPCHPRSHTTQICMPDCVSFLHDCLDFDRISDTENVAGICSILSAQSGKPCVPLAIYQDQAYVKSSAMVIYHPCEAQPCNNNQVCRLNSECNNDIDCVPYYCVDGCRLGEVSKVTVEVGALVRLPTPNPGCHRLCRCIALGQVSQCLAPKCDSAAPCWLHRIRIDHGSTFAVDCNLCSCRSGEISCTKQPCTGEYKSSRRYSSVSCPCPSAQSPVCGSNGKTYLSHCVARCSGLNDAELEPGACQDLNSCAGVYCGRDQKCVSFRRICLHQYRRKCLQYQCVPSVCEKRETVCDTKNREHLNLCEMAAAGEALSHTGPCVRHGCDPLVPICGVDGLNYPSECAAEGKGIPKDYAGRCRYLAVTGNEVGCPQVACPLIDGYCEAIWPPGACCPICAGLVRITFSPSLTLQLIETPEAEPITVDVIRRKIESFVKVAECRVGVYLGQGAELVVILKPRLNPYSRAHLDMCVAEAHRVSVLVNHKSPTLQVDAVLNLLSGAVSFELGNTGSDTSGRLVLVWVSALILFELG